MSTAPHVHACLHQRNANKHEEHARPGNATHILLSAGCKVPCRPCPHHVCRCVRDCSWHPYLPLLATVSFDGSVTTWEPEVPGEAEAAREEAAAAADAAHPGSGRRVAKGGRQRHLPAPMGDQHAW